MKVASESRQEKQALLESTSALRTALYLGPLTSSSGLGGLVRREPYSRGCAGERKGRFPRGSKDLASADDMMPYGHQDTCF